MTIAKRLMILLGVPILVLLLLGIFGQEQLSQVEQRSQFVAQQGIGSLATIGNLSRCFADVRGAIFERPPWIKDSATAPDKVADKSNVEDWVW